MNLLGIDKLLFKEFSVCMAPEKCFIKISYYFQPMKHLSSLTSSWVEVTIQHV